MKLLVRLELDWPTLLPACRAAVEHRERLQGGARADYAMTKATAARVVKAFADKAAGDSVERDHFDWSCLVGELARLAASRGRRADDESVRACLILRGALLAAPGVAALHERAARLDRLRRRAGQLREELREVEEEVSDD
jgi:hypothetical protein